MTASFDLIVLGAGSGGYACALRAAQLGQRVALVEKDKVGGTCLHRGCVPAKALLHAAEVADAARHAADVGVIASIEGVDAARLRDYSASVVKKLHTGLAGLVASRGIRVVEGTGQLVRDESGLAVVVGDNRLQARHVVVATGSRPRTLGLPIDHEHIVTSDDALWLDRLPRTAIVLGGGVIGVEFAPAWTSLGVEVTIVEALDRLMPGEIPAISQTLTRAFRRRGITARTGTAIAEARVTDGEVRVRLDSGETLAADLLLVAVGREPASEGIGLAEAGVSLDEGGWVRVDDHLATAAPGVYAVGDLVRGPQLAHRGFGHGIHVAERIAQLSGRSDLRPRLTPDHLVPRVTYSSPEIASVGLSADQARAAEPGMQVDTVTYDLTGSAKAQILRTQGFVQVVAEHGGPVLGIHMIGDRVSDLVGEAQLTVSWGAHADEVAELLHAHPTLDEALGEAMLALAGKPLHSHG
ncbi:MAG: dihydrolipoyl dehydrogenase [Propionibacterium sp.]|nr:dihydrolipoyl dehydrogenase [Propionibacterium sp.]